MSSALALVLQALIDTEATQHIGAQPYERTDIRTAYRNGVEMPAAARTAGSFSDS